GPRHHALLQSDDRDSPSLSIDDARLAAAAVPLWHRPPRLRPQEPRPLRDAAPNAAKGAALRLQSGAAPAQEGAADGFHRTAPRLPAAAVPPERGVYRGRV